jgi:hypothetical protein
MSTKNLSYDSQMDAAIRLMRQNHPLWDLFIRKEELGGDRPDYYKSYCYSANSPYLEPHVSKYLVHQGFRASYPGDRPFAVCLSHDVDNIYPPLTHTILSSAHSLKELNFNGLRQQLLWPIYGKESSPYRNFREIMAMEEKYDAVSSFYFKATDKDINGYVYDPRDLENELGMIVDNGFEVGLHGGYYVYDDPEAIKKEKHTLEKILGRKVIGYRNHYLCFKVPETWAYLADAGFKYDSTLGYNNAVGCRNGMCHPFKPYDEEGNRIDILEIPLLIMDVSLFSSAKHLKEAWETSRALIDEVRSCNGVLTLLWHNIMFGSSFRKDWGKLYYRILEYCHESGAWITNGENIHRWWEENAC